MSLNTFINDLHISEGESIRMDCPSCRSRNTFTATKIDGNIVYNCYKLSCYIRGKVHSGYDRKDISRMLSRVSESQPKEEAFVLPVYVTNAIEDKRMILDSDDIDSLRSVHKMVKNINVSLREKNNPNQFYVKSKLRNDKKDVYIYNRNTS